MNYAYATLMLSESDEEINEQNLTAVLEASGTAFEASRVKAIVAAMEDIDVDDVVSTPIDDGPTDSADDSFEEPEELLEAPSDSVSGSEDADTPTEDEEAEASGTESDEEL